MKSNKIEKTIKGIILLLPLLVLGLYLFRNTTIHSSSYVDLLTSIESVFSNFRQFDFGLSDYLIANFFNNTNNIVLLLMFDLFIYYMYYLLIDFVYICMSSIILLCRKLLRKVVD